MTTLKLIETFVAAAIIFAAIDLGWITFVVSKMYREEVGSIILAKPRVLPGVLFYLIYMAGLLYFAIVPAIDHGTAASAARDGALYGLFTYATFDLTNWSVLEAWTLKVVLADVAWGVFISATVAGLTYFVMSSF